MNVRDLTIEGLLIFSAGMIAGTFLAVACLSWRGLW